MKLPMEYPSHVYRVFKAPVTYRGIILLSMASFSSYHLRRITNIFFINFPGLQQVFAIFNLLNSTEVTDDKYKSYD